MIPPCLTLSIIRYVWRVKWSNPGKEGAPSPTPRCSSYRKKSLLVTLDYDRPLTYWDWSEYNKKVAKIIKRVKDYSYKETLEKLGLTTLLDGNYTRMLRAILNKSWRQHPTRHQLYDHLPPITKTIQVRRTRHAGHWWRSRDELIRDVLLWTPHMAMQKQDDQHEHTFSSYVRIRDVVLKTCLGRWTIGRSGERGSGISVLPARHDDDDDFTRKKNDT